MSSTEGRGIPFCGPNPSGGRDVGHCEGRFRCPAGLPYLLYAER